MIENRDEIIIVNKYEETSVVDGHYLIERVFKMFYDLQINKKIGG